jgi:hypothetical protein
VKHCLPVRQPGLQISGRHRELIEVGEETERRFVNTRETGHGREAMKKE